MNHKAASQSRLRTTLQYADVFHVHIAAVQLLQLRGGHTYLHQIRIRYRAATLTHCGQGILRVDWVTFSQRAANELSAITCGVPLYNFSAYFTNQICVSHVSYYG